MTGTVKWQCDTESELSAGEIQCNAQTLIAPLGLTCGEMIHGVIVIRLAVIFRTLVVVDAVRKINIRTSTYIRTEAVQLVLMFVFLPLHILIPIMF